jgi:hypothetical protein
MIHYQLRCTQGHEFDGWFKDSATFEKQAARGLVECPACGDAAVSRALMTPALGSRRPVSPATSPPQAEPHNPPSPPANTSSQLPDQVRAVLQRLRNEVERNCDYVGPRFADEARRMHRGESDRRAIYGETTLTEAEALDEEGITYSRIPWVPRAEG